MLTGKPDAGNLHVRFDEGEQRDWRKPPVALYSTGLKNADQSEVGGFQPLLHPLDILAISARLQCHPHGRMGRETAIFIRCNHFPFPKMAG